MFFPRDSLSKRFSTLRIPYNISCLDKISSDGHKRCLLSSLYANLYNSNRIYTIINSIITVATVSALSSVNTPFLNLSIALRFDIRHYNWITISCVIPSSYFILSPISLKQALTFFHKHNTTLFMCLSGYFMFYVFSGFMVLNSVNI